MNELTGDRDAVLEVLRQTIFHLGSGKPEIRTKGMKHFGLTSDANWTTQRDTAIDLLQRAYQRENDKTAQDNLTKNPSSQNKQKTHRTGGFGITAPSESVVKDWYMPRDRTVAVFQAAMDEFIDKKLSEVKTAPTKSKPQKGSHKLSLTVKENSTDRNSTELAKPGIDLFFVKKSQPPQNASLSFAGFERFDNLDPGWIEVVWEKAKSLLRGKAKFIKHTSATDFRFEIIDQPKVKIALVSDWGGGNEAAEQVGEQIQICKPDYAIHLGDVYYAGTEHEINHRFLNLWNFQDDNGIKSRSFALNSNHEMYGGGNSYFKLTLKAFGQPASYFSLGNQHWKFIGLDSAYVDGDLNAEQIDWLSGQLDGSAKTILLSHHQPFSGFAGNDSGAQLRMRVQPFLSNIYGWFWGHEHLCAIYGEHLGIKGRCIGHGCLPYEIPEIQSAEVPVEWFDQRKQPNGRGMHGFALLTLEQDKMQIEYIDQNGTVAKTESF